jgi:hypothetical protein
MEVRNCIAIDLKSLTLNHTSSRLIRLDLRFGQTSPVGPKLIGSFCLGQTEYSWKIFTQVSARPESICSFQYGLN